MAIHELRRRGILGIDEVGRGALAGPVFVAAVWINNKFLCREKNILRTLKDSKQLTPNERENWYRYFIRVPDIIWSIAKVSPRVIDQINVSQAANLAAFRGYHRIIHVVRADEIYLDGGLYLKSRMWQENNVAHATTLPKADEIYNAVMAASIMAKVMRDQYMKRLDQIYQGYSFGIHKGYGTPFHRGAIRNLGPSVVHRLTFLGNGSKVK